MFETIITWVGLALLFLLCLPISGLQRLLLTLYGLVLRLGMIALIVAAGYLWFYPARLPSVVADTVRDTPLLARILPEPGSSVFAVCAVGLIAIFVLPTIAVLSACRRRLSGKIVEAVVVEEPPVAIDARRAPATPPSVPPQVGRRDAANRFAGAGR